MRDPRKNPKPGDILRIGGKFDSIFFEVLEHDPRYNETDVSFTSDGREYVFSLNQWRQNMHIADILIVDKAKKSV